MNLKRFKKTLDRLVIFGGLRDDAVVRRRLKATGGRRFSEYLYALTETAARFGEYGESDALFAQHIMRFLLTNENVFSLACERGDCPAPIYELARKEIKKVTELAGFDNAELLFKTLTESYKTNGCGVLYGNTMFTFENGKITPVKNPDIPDFNDIIGNERQKRLIRLNVEAFLQSRSGENIAANMLLTGPRGTGKSTCVKALAGKYGGNGLKMVFVSREQYVLLPELTDLLSARGKKFIVVLDDLSFDLSLENAEAGYKRLKSILEGGAQRRPNNVLFCATSNRRNLVVQRSEFSVKGLDCDEVHMSDAVNERQSLKERFGLAAAFAKPTPDEFFEIAKQLLAKQGVCLPDEQLRGLANQQELGQNGMSGRAARDLVFSIISHRHGEHAEI